MRVQIEEGPRYKVRNVSFSGNKVYSPEQLMPGMSMIGGDIYSLQKVSDDSTMIRRYYGAKGYADAGVRPDINEVGTDPAQFIEKYSQLIDHIQAHQPSAQIYVQAILPVSRATHERNVYMVNNDNIRMFNQLISDMAQAQQVHFIDTYEALADSEGFLPDDASSDGIHLSRDYNQIWMNYLKEHVK
jgi:hypothetical protein